MEDAPQQSPERSSSDSEGSAPAVADPVGDGSDKENRRTLEDMFNDDSDDDEFSSSPPQKSEPADSQEQTYVYFTSFMFAS